MKRLSLLLTLLLVAASLSAQRLERPQLDYQRYERKAMDSVLRLHDKQYNPNEAYSFIYIFSVENDNETVDKILAARSDSDFIDALKFESSRHSRYAAIDRAIICDSEGCPMWQYLYGKADRLPQGSDYFAKLTNAIKGAEFDIVFSIIRSDNDYFGYKEGKIYIIESDFNVIPLSECLTSVGLEYYFADYLASDGDRSPNAHEGLQCPTFQGGDLNRFREWIYSEMVYPEECAAKGVEGRVVFQFIVDEGGNTTAVEFLQSPDKLFEEELSRVLKRAPRWQPATVGGVAQAHKFVLPVDFKQSENHE